MKRVKEILYEKFEEQSDPIKDMGIGGISFGKLRYKMKQTFKDMWKSRLDELLLGRTISGKLNEYLISDKKQGYIHAGKGWGEYTIKVTKIADYDIDENGITVYSQIDDKAYAYIIPMNEDKIYIRD